MKKLLDSDLFNVMIENMPDAIIVADNQDMIKIFNGEVLKVFGYESDELIGRNIEMLMPERYKDVYKSEKNHFLTNQKKGRISGGRKVMGLKKDGTEFEADVSIAPVYAEDNLFFISSIRDISDIKEEERKLSSINRDLENINKELERYNYTISHDLKAPLHKIESLTNALLDEIKEGRPAEDLENVSGYIKDSLSSAERLISDVLDQTKAGKAQNERIDMKKLFDELNHLLSVPGNFRFEIHCSHPYVYGKRVNLLQVFLNLLSNSIKYNDKPEGQICVSCQEIEDNYIFIFSDNGMGIAEERLEKIFDLYEHSKDGKRNSHGIGLHTVKSIIEARGGKILVKSKEGIGTKFVFTWPKG